MIICKFGGSSISTTNNIIKITNILLEKLHDDRVTCIFSAMGKTTDNIIKCGETSLINIENAIPILDEIENFHCNIVNKLFINHDISKIMDEINSIFEEIHNICRGIYYLKDLSDKTRDRLVSYGEILSSKIIFNYIKNYVSIYPEHSDKIYKIVHIDTSKYIKTDSNFGNAKPDFDLTSENLLNIYNQNRDTNLFIVTGFIASDIYNNITTLGRGGGDYTAAIFGYCLNSSIVEIWTDVDGIMSSDPRRVKNAFSIDRISYKEMLELSHYGANVIYTPTILPLYEKKIPIIVKNTNNPEHPGTLIEYDVEDKNNIATALSNLENIAVLKIFGEYLIGKVGFSGNLFTHFSNNNINVIMISQSSSEHSIYIVIYLKDLDKTLRILNREYKNKIEKGMLSIISKDDKSVIAVETDNQKNILEIMSKIFPILKNNNINIYTLTTSDHNICMVIDKKYINRTLNLIHQELFFDHKKNIFILGCGLVGTELIKQLYKIEDINIKMIANSKKYISDNISIDNWKNDLLSIGIEYNIDSLIGDIINMKLNNSIFIDCTSSDQIYPYYEKLLSNNISIVTPNKKANTANIELFNRLTNYDNYKYETTVGAGLPIIQTIQNIINSGDTVLRVEAILSGSLSYIFNSFMINNNSFSEIVKEAQQLGYTEPNPRDDLNGSDAVRKILIIARLLGYNNLEIEDVINNPFISKECLNSETTEEFYENLENFNSDMSYTKNYALNMGVKPKHVALLERGSPPRVQVNGITQEHPFYNLSGSDNMIIITTKYYHKNPIVIRGPGAGATVTASGIISDLYRIQ